MGRGGRNRKPTALHIVEGTARPGRLNKHEPIPGPGPVTMPGWLEPEARRLWRSLAPELDRLGLLTILDRAAFAAYCTAYARWRAAEAIIAKEGAVVPGRGGVPKKHPAVTIAKQSMELLRRFGEEFGLSPQSRGRLNISPPDQDDEDDFEGLLD